MGEKPKPWANVKAKIKFSVTKGSGHTPYKVYKYFPSKLKKSGCKLSRKLVACFATRDDAYKYRKTKI